MTRTWMAAVVGVAVAAGAARADWGGYNPPRPQQGPAAGPGEFTSPNTLAGLGHTQAHKPADRYGLLPGLRKLFHVGKGDCPDCGGKHGRGDGCGPGGCGPFGGGRPGGPGAGGYGPYGPGNPPGVMQGTLAFPHHPFVRSPRDFFMYEGGR